MPKRKGGEELVYAKADVLKREKTDEVVRFVDYWKSVSGQLPEELVFDSQMTDHKGLAELHRRGITFLTLRERQPKEVERVLAFPESAWKTVTLSGENRVFRHPKVLEEQIEVSE
ncbi:transposase, IS4, partial [mine drainage metagenome]